jgi:hypothetical protein
MKIGLLKAIILLGPRGRCAEMRFNAAEFNINPRTKTLIIRPARFCISAGYLRRKRV